MTEHTHTEHHTLPLSYDTPPLTLNFRGHWAQKARLTKDIRREVHLRARAANLPKNCDHITVTLHYLPAVNRDRDTDNLIGTLKPAIDALAAGTKKHPGYGMVADDTPQFVTRPEPVIHPADPAPRRSRLWLEIDIQKGDK